MARWEGGEGVEEGRAVGMVEMSDVCLSLKRAVGVILVVVGVCCGLVVGWGDGGGREGKGGCERRILVESNVVGHFAARGVV